MTLERRTQALLDLVEVDRRTQCDAILSAAQGRASALLAIELKADLLMIPTGVERVAIRFGHPDQQWLDRISVAQAERYASEGHFGDGSMGPKIEAIVKFVKARHGARGVITHPDSIARALRGETGTWIANV